MWGARITGLLIAVGGGGLMEVLRSALAERSRADLFVDRVGTPGVLLLGALGTIAIVFGLYLLLAPQSALGRRPARPRRRA